MESSSEYGPYVQFAEGFDRVYERETIAKAFGNVKRGRTRRVRRR
jgi:hypothetical protein